MDIKQPQEFDRVYKAAIIASLGIYAIYLGLPYLWKYIYSKESLDVIYVASGHGSFFIPENWVIYGLVVLTIVSKLGLYFYKTWAKKLFLLIVFLNVIATSMFGLNVQGYLDATLATILNLLDGALLVMVFGLVKR